MGTRFEPTEIMSTHLLAMVVSDYKKVSTTQGDVLVEALRLRNANANANTTSIPLDPDLDFFF